MKENQMDLYLKEIFEKDYLFKEKVELEKLTEELKKESKYINEKLPHPLPITIIIFCFNLVSLFSKYLDCLISSERDVQFERKFRDILKKIGEPTGSKISIRNIKKIDEPNAFCAGGRSLFYTDKLKKMLTQRELVAVMLHEYQHFKSLHVYINLLATTPIKTFAIYLSIIAANRTYSLPLLIFLFMLFTSILSIPYDITIGRLMEYSADGYAARAGYGDELISGLKKLEQYMKTYQKKLTPVGKLFLKIAMAIDGHPSLKNRLDNILKQKEIFEGSAKQQLIKFKLAVSKAFNLDQKVFLNVKIDDKT